MDNEMTQQNADGVLATCISKKNDKTPVVFYADVVHERELGIRAYLSPVFFSRRGKIVKRGRILQRRPENACK